MSDEEALIGAIWENPYDDTPRLAYADWLQETGEEANVARAEFIRIQCELARIDDDDPPRSGAHDLEIWSGLGVIDCPSNSPRRAELVQRETKLRRAYADKWRTGDPVKLRPAPFHRGFIAPRRQLITAKKFLEMTPAHLSFAPLWSFRMFYHSSNFPKALASSTFQRVGTLEMWGRLEKWADPETTAAHLRALANSPNVRSISRFRPISNQRAGDTGLLALAESPHLSNLTALDFSSQDLTSSGLARALDRRKKSRPLHELYLRCNELDDSAVSAITHSSWCSELRALSLGESLITDTGVIELVRSPVMTKLRYLHLEALTQLSDRAVIALAESPNAANLRILFLGNNQFGDRGVAALAGSPHLERIEYLQIPDANITKSGQAVKGITRRFGEKLQFF